MPTINQLIKHGREQRSYKDPYHGRVPAEKRCLPFRLYDFPEKAELRSA